MKVNRRFLYGGVFLVAAGGVLLVAQGDAISTQGVLDALRLWPLVLVALGIGLLLRRTRLNLAGGMLAVAAPGLLLGGLVVAAPRVAFGCGDAVPAGSAARQGAFIGPAIVNLALACGDLIVTTTPGTGWQLQTGDNPGHPAVVDASADRLAIASSSQSRAFDFLRGGDAWRLALPTANPLDLTAEVSAGRGRFDMAGAQLGSLAVTVNAGDTRVDLGEATVGRLSMSVNAAAGWLRLPVEGDTRADLSVNAGSLKVCADPGLGLRIRGSTVLGSSNYPGLVRTGDTWQSPDYATATHHADLTISVNVGSVNLNPLGGCQ